MTTYDERLAGALASTIAVATGREHREEPVLPRTGGPAGNAVLTAWTGLVLLVLFVSELLTLLNMHALISWHVVIGALLVPPALLKTGSTGWRMVRYYRGHEAYEVAGPPPLLLRVLGPLVVLSTLGLLASGGMLAILGRQASRHVLVTLPLLRVDWVTVHQGMFAVWAGATGLHLIGRLVPALRIAIVRRIHGHVPGRAPRLVAGLVALAVAVPLAFLAVHVGGSWIP
jgi:hypothetical protein